jgi:hypothetical protein
VGGGERGRKGKELRRKGKEKGERRKYSTYIKGRDQ